MEIETARLRLREAVRDDWEALHRYHSLPQVRRQMLPGQGTAAYTRGWVNGSMAAARQVPRRFYGLVITLKAEGTVIGTCNLSLPSQRMPRASMGWDVAPEHWGRGYATEAARALLDFGGGELGLGCVTAQCFADNIASRRVMEKIGMRRTRVGIVSGWYHRFRRRTLRPWVQYGTLGQESGGQAA